jgi:hypothetical protein
MEKLNKEEIDKIREKIKPYWKEFQRLEREFFHKTGKLQKKMSRDLNLGIDLEFFYADGECVGIGASDYSNREKFPLIQDLDFDE